MTIETAKKDKKFNSVIKAGNVIIDYMLKHELKKMRFYTTFGKKFTMEIEEPEAGDTE